MMPNKGLRCLVMIALFLMAAGGLAAGIHQVTLAEIDYAAIESGQVEVRSMGDTLQEYYEEYGDDFAQVSSLLRQSDLVILGTPSSAYRLLPTSVDREVQVDQVFKGEAPGDMIHVVEPSFIWFYSNGDFSARALLGYAPMEPQKTYILFLTHERGDIYTITYMAFGKYPAGEAGDAMLIDWEQPVIYGQVYQNPLLSSDAELLAAYLKMHDEVKAVLAEMGRN